jgi:hypothetical protein
VTDAGGNANALAVCPDGNDCDAGIGTWRLSGTTLVSRSGRRRRASGLMTTLTTVLVNATDASPRPGRRGGPAPHDDDQHRREGERRRPTEPATRTPPRRSSP